MVGNRAATIDELETRTRTAEHLFPAAPMCRFGSAAQRIDRRVLKEQQDIPLPLCNPFFLELFLKCPSLGIGDRLHKPNECTSLRSWYRKRPTSLSMDIMIWVRSIEVTHKTAFSSVEF